MKTLAAISIIGGAVMLCACASQPVSGDAEDELPLHLSRDAKRVLDDKGEVTAAKTGTRAARSSDLECRTIKRTGSHLTEVYCYTDREAQRHREKVVHELGPRNRGNVLPDVGER